MAFIVQTFHNPNVKEEDIKKPILYVDSINASSYAVEMNNICISYIRNNSNVKASDAYQFKSAEHTLKKELDIYSKPDGYYYVSDDKANTFVMYKISRSTGYFYRTCTTVDKIFTLISIPGKKVCPKVFEKGDKKEEVTFESELKSRVAKFRDRADTGIIMTTNKSLVLTVDDIKSQ